MPTFKTTVKRSEDKESTFEFEADSKQDAIDKLYNEILPNFDWGQVKAYDSDYVDEEWEEIPEVSECAWCGCASNSINQVLDEKDNCTYECPSCGLRGPFRMEDQEAIIEWNEIQKAILERQKY